MIKKILVTGSSGTIGTRLCEVLLKEGYKVTGVDIIRNKWSEDVDKNTIILDLRDYNSVMKKIPKDIDLIIHLAANARVYDLVLNPSLAKDNFDMLFNVLEFVRVNDIKKIMFASSREVYGNSSVTMHSEDDVKIEMSESPYSTSKLASESLIYSYNKCYGIDFIIFRFSNVYGMYDESDRVVPLFIRKCLKNEDLVIFGEEKLLDFTYINDTVAGIISAISKFDYIKNDVFNIAFGTGTKILDIAHMIKSLLKTNNEITIDKSRTGEVIKYVADISKAKKIIGYEPTIPVEEGIKKSVEWYTKNLYTDK